MVSKILKNSTIIFISNTILRVIQLIQGVIIANIFGPLLLGVKESIQIYLNYMNNIDLGTISVFERERQINEYKNVQLRDYYTNSIFSIILITSLLLILFISLISIYINYNITYKISLIVASIICCVSLLHTINVIILKSRHQFIEYSKINLTGGILSFILIIILSYYYGLLGFFLGNLLGIVILFIFSIYISNYRPKFIFDLRAYKSIFVESKNLFILSLFVLILSSLGRIFIWYFYGFEQLGYYSIGIFFASIINFFILTLVIAITPSIFQNIENKDMIKVYVLESHLYLHKIIYFLLFVILIFTPLIIYILPEYFNSIRYIYILCFSVVFYPHIFWNYFIAKRDEYLLIISTLIFVFIYLILNIFIIYYSLSVFWIAYSNLYIYLFYSIFITIQGCKSINEDLISGIIYLYKLLYPFVYSLIGFLICIYISNIFFTNIFYLTFCKLLIFIFWYIPILILIFRKLVLRI